VNNYFKIIVLSKITGGGTSVVHDSKNINARHTFRTQFFLVPFSVLEKAERLGTKFVITTNVLAQLTVNRFALVHVTSG